MLISFDRTVKNQVKPDQESNGVYTSVVALFFVKKPLTKTDRCAGALSCRRNQLLAPHFSECFLPTISLRGRRMLVYIYIFTVLHKFSSCNNSWKLYQLITGARWSYCILHCYLTYERQTPLILNREIRWTCVVSLTPRLLYPQMK